MSGDETGDLSLHDLRQIEEPVTSRFKVGPQKGQNLKTVHKSNYIPFWQLNALMVMIVLSASGMVSLQDLAFVLFSVIYLFFLSKFAFPRLSDPSQEPPVFNPKSYLVRLGQLFSGLIGIVLPVAYIFEGFIEGDKEGISAAAPHVFLLASQVFMDGVACSDRFSTPREFSKADQVYGGSASERRLYLGKGLAIANLVFWTYHLFFFLLPVYLPRAFRKYYAAEKTE
ncbi:hypothetical protein M0R45_038067 [Rubus argutus]|uniref:DUF7733 domain-containing protein n=1 Tax=Rubus argutus TaxID=59490 RepID=A0AAW1W2B2_RUBAR